MSKVTCSLKLSEVPLHLYQIIAGFKLLSKQGIVDLHIDRVSKNSPDKLPYNMMEVRINNQIKVLYDVNDGYDNLLTENHSYVDFMDGLLQNYDICFKRSFNRLYNSKLKNEHKVFPLGLNYMVTIPGNIAHVPMPNDPTNEKVKKLIRMLPLSQHSNIKYYVQSFESVPLHKKDPKILFMARLWDLNEKHPLGISAAKKEERSYINDFRAECIRLCKKEFGNKFFGGISQSEFANRYYKDIVIQDNSITKRNKYLQMVKNSSICISTMGLHQSIGWKFAEYIAASKAIVTEELHYEVPGNLKEGENYLVFKTPSECVEKINLLLIDEEFRFRMMNNNFTYYQEYVSPDKLVLNSILATVQKFNCERILTG
ncbi:glycosyltransferase family 1 protein [Alkalihalobacillus sp. BA299]|uniref:glycosyltransferase family 1 protein n=1 Tax=Alkalihalobacillus sp. BA299 TaxID=2815938 RepID=UPI001ADB0774|nr:glycosyltransferase family 1 protein [Alkalihalobacillus sp. BA299]